MTRTPVFTTGYVICVVLGLADVAGLAGLAMDDPPPTVVVLLGGLFGLVTLAGAVPAWRGHRAGQVTVVGSRVLSAMLAAPAFFVPASAWERLLAAVMIVLSIVGLGLLVSGARQRALAP
ncbi:hypothetical protein [Amycolatopsis australiensis]|uniref:Integral membrane protein n=1 Tax=Amycolatopsis australiensis TaxID=546364 RepID=A0A1K1SMG1_9PSEU|nr:hypothetical protein [Amycolatopsis australiensis]SFW85053.1 hypothetical protein SAMN04489730_6030 [Amycolatopsis australiensis]